MSRPRRELVPGSCYHVTTRCNNREFHLTQPLCRNLLLYALSQAHRRRPDPVAPGLLDSGRNAGRVQRAISQLLPAISPGDQAQAAGHEWLGKPAAPPAFQETGVRAPRFTLPPGLRVPGNGAPIPPGHGYGRPCLGPGPSPCWCGRTTGIVILGTTRRGGSTAAQSPSLPALARTFPSARSRSSSRHGAGGSPRLPPRTRTSPSPSRGG